MLSRSLGHLLDWGGDGGATLSAFRSRRSPESTERCRPDAELAPGTSWEEAEEGAIYAVSARASEGDRGSSGSGGEEASGAAQPSEGAAAACGSPAGQSRALKAGSLPRLVRHLLEAPALGDAGYRPAFLATYRSFAEPPAIVGLLLERLQAVAEPEASTPQALKELQRTLASLLCSWLDGYPQDFEGLGPRLREEVQSWLHWAQESSSGPKRSLPVCLRAGEPQGGEEAKEQEGDASRCGHPDPHYILGLQAEDVAAHLTAQDAGLFLRLVPQECLGSLWSQRDKKGHERDCPTVRATVAQFNLVAKAVIVSCLGEKGLRAAQRARLLEKWIRVAEECFCLRNFSSLYAVVSALQSTALHRLRRTWEEISRDSARCYEDLSTICSEQDNYSQSRQLLFQEGCPRGGPGAEYPQHKPQRRRPEQRPTGVIPYLGTFLKDLVMLDAATRDRLENGYINFEKHRKEFEILTRLRLLQAKCRDYVLVPDRTLQRWLCRLPGLTETQSYRLSCAIEPPTEGVPPTRPSKPTLVITHCTDLATSSAEGMLMPWDQPGGPPAVADLLGPPAAFPWPPAQQAKWASVSALEAAPLSTAPPSSPGGQAPLPPTGGGFTKGHRRSASCGSVYPQAPSLGGTSPSDGRVIRVRLAQQTSSLYKSLLVTSQEKAPAVVAKVLEKHNHDQALAPDYELVQILPEGRELAFPPTANVFYAMSGSSVDFMLRLKRPPGKPPSPPPPPRTPPAREREISATFPKIKATGRRIARALF